MAEVTFKEAARVQVSLLAPLEKKCLIWLAHHMPNWVNSDHLTFLGFIGIILAGVSYWLAHWNKYALLLVILGLAVNWFGDSLDGTLARVRKKERPRYGFYVDHLLDAFGQLFLLGGLALSGYMHERLAIGLLLAYYLLSIHVYIVTHTFGTFHLTFWKLSTTELRIILSIGNIIILFYPKVKIFNKPILLYDIAGVFVITVMGVMMISYSVKNLMLLYRSEKTP